MSLFLMCLGWLFFGFLFHVMKIEKGGVIDGESI
jgi:hypothetical protein